MRKYKITPHHDQSCGDGDDLYSPVAKSWRDRLTHVRTCPNGAIILHDATTGRTYVKQAGRISRVRVVPV